MMSLACLFDTFLTGEFCISEGMFRVGTMFQNSLAKLGTLWYDYIKYEINNGGNENAEHNVCPC